MAGLSNNYRMAAIFARNSIVLGDLDAYCLICLEMLPEVKGAIIHIQGSNHKTCADSRPEPEYVVKFRDDFIRKINFLYFCELCNDVIPTITSVNIHVTQESHLQCKSRKFERLGTSILFQDDILITDSAWNGQIEDFCVICEVKFTDYELHKSKPSHILGVIQSRVTIDGENDLYRKLTDGYHCLTCNIFLSSNLLEKHLNSPEHFNAIVRHESTQADDNARTNESDKNYNIEAEGNGAGEVRAVVAERMSIVCVGVTNGTSSSRADTKTETRKQDEQPSNTDGNTRTDESDKNDDKDAESNGAGGVYADIAKGGVTKETSSYGTVTNTSQQDKQSSNTDGNTKTDDSDKNDDKDAEGNGTGGVCASVAKGGVTKGTNSNGTDTNTSQQNKPPNTDGNTKNSTTVEDTNKSFTSKSKSQVEAVANDQQLSNTIGNTKKSARVSKTKKPSPSKLAKVKATNKSSPSKLAVDKDTNEPSPAKPAPVEEHRSSTSKPMPKDKSSLKAGLLEVLEALEVFTKNSSLPSDEKSSNTDENAKTRTAVQEQNKPSTSKQKAKIENLVKQFKGLSVQPDGIVKCRLCKVEVLPTTETAVKEHVNKVDHKQNLPSISDAKDPRIKKKLTRDFVTVEEIIEDANGTKYAVINCSICCPNLHYLGFVDCQDKYFCHFCDIDVKTSNEDMMAHLSTPTHSQLLENSYVVTTLKGDFIRQINGDFYHCGICGITKSKYDDMLDHVATTLHVQAKSHCKSKQHFFQFRQLLNRCNLDPNSDKIKKIENLHWK